MELLDRSRTHTPGTGWTAWAEPQRASATRPAGRRHVISHHLPVGGMVPEAMGFSPSLPDREFHRGWTKPPLSLAVPGSMSPRASPSPRSTPPRAPIGGSTSMQQLLRDPGSPTIDTQATAADTHQDSPRSSRASTPRRASTPPSSHRAGVRGSYTTSPRRAEPLAGFSPRRATPPSQSYSTTSQDYVGLGEPAGHGEVRACGLSHTRTDSFKRDVGGVVPGYGGHVPNAITHFGNTHVGGVLEAATGHGRYDGAAGVNPSWPRDDHPPPPGATAPMVPRWAATPPPRRGSSPASKESPGVNAYPGCRTPPASSRQRLLRGGYVVDRGRGANINDWNPPAWAMRPSPQRMADLKVFDVCA